MGRTGAVLMAAAVAFVAGCSEGGREVPDASGSGAAGSAAGAPGASGAAGAPPSSGGAGGGRAGVGGTSGAGGVAGGSVALEVWSEVPGPPNIAGESIIDAWTAGPDDTFFVARHLHDGATMPWSARVLRWTAAAGWQEELAIAPAQSPLVSISGTGPDDVWLAGNGSIYHRDAQGWRTVPTDDWAPQIAGAAPWTFVDVAARAPDDVWFAASTFLLHKTSAGWSAYVIHDPPEPRGPQEIVRRFGSLWLGRGDDVWVSGTTDTSSTMDPAFVARYVDGELVYEPVRLYLSPPESAWVTSDGGFWYAVVGYHYFDAAMGQVVQTSLCHYAPDSWVAAFTETFADAPYKEVYSVWGRADDDVWAAGRIASWPETRPLLLHYEGSQWTEVRDAPSAGSSNVLVTGDARTVWLVSDDPRFFRLLPRYGH